MTDLAEPISIGEYAARLRKLNAPRRYAVAVSGGRDSMALARIAALHARTGAADVRALIVDHGLRPAAAEEAAAAARWCEDAGLRASILRWTGDKPTSGIQAAARSARYKLLIEASQRADLGALLTAHTADDQAETVFMRLARGSGPRGLSAMAPSSMVAAGPSAPLLLLRPFLETARARIEATIGVFAQEYVDDPSNDDPKYERVTTRALLAALEEQGLLTRDALLRVAERSRAAVARLDWRLETELASAGGCFHRWGYVTFSNPPDEISPELMSRLLQAVGGSDHAPAEDAAWSFVKALVDGAAATLAGVIGKTQAGLHYIAREPAAVLGRADLPGLSANNLPAGARILWDRRFIIENRSREPRMIVPLGRDPIAMKAASRALNAPPEAVQAIPAVVWGEGCNLIDRTQGVSAEALVESAFRRRIARYH